MFPCLADHDQGWQPYSVDPYSAESADHTHKHKYVHTADASTRTLWYVYIICVVPAHISSSPSILDAHQRLCCCCCARKASEPFAVRRLRSFVQTEYGHGFLHRQ